VNEVDNRRGRESLVGYWQTGFRDDLRRVQAAVPPVGDHAPGTTIQPGQLGAGNPVLGAFSPRRRRRFRDALFMMLALDRMVAVDRPRLYPAFAATFGAPRFLADGRGEHAFVLAPSTVLACVPIGPSHAASPFRESLLPGIADPTAANIARAVYGELLPDPEGDRLADAFMAEWCRPVFIDSPPPAFERDPDSYWQYHGG
jgi:hypothetical protein